MSTQRAWPLKGLLPLAGAVLGAHVALLQWTPSLPRPVPDAGPGAFTTRLVAAAPQAVPAPAPAEVLPAPAPAHAARSPALPPTKPVAPQDRPPPIRPASSITAAEPSAPVAAAHPSPPDQAALATTHPTPAGAAHAAGQPAAVLAVPPSTRLRYEVTAEARGFSLSGQAQLDWRQDGSHYEARLELSGPLLPSRTQRSIGRITDEGLAPAYFADRHRGEQATHFDREKGRLVFSNNRPDAALPDGVQDRLSVVMQLAALVGGQPARYAPGTAIQIPTASTREAETWQFVVEHMEDLALPGGTVPALKLHRQPRKEHDQRIEVWLAPGMHYAPVRIRLTQANGDSVDQRWLATDKG